MARECPNAPADDPERPKTGKLNFSVIQNAVMNHGS